MREKRDPAREIRIIERKMERGTASSEDLDRYAKYAAMIDAKNAFEDDKHGRMTGKARGKK